MATRSELLTALQGATGVVDAVFANTPAPVPNLTDLWHVDVIYVHSTGGVTKSNRVRVLIQGADADTGTAEWERALPEPLRGPGPGPYISARTVGGWNTQTEAQQRSAIHGFLSNVWRDAQSNPALEDIRSLEITAEDSNTIKVTADFQVAGGWSTQTWYVKLSDANGSVNPADGNIIFQQVNP